MTGFQKIALLHSHPRVPLTQDYYVSDLIELCSLAAVIREQVEHVSIPVTPADRDPLGSFERFMRKSRPDLVGISCFTCSAKSAFEYARVAKKYGAFVITGGYHPSALPEEMLASNDFDAVVRGEGEMTFKELVAGASLDTIAGLSMNKGGAVIHNPDRPLIDDLDALPLPLREIRPPRFGLSGLDYHVDTIYTSRGCRGKCSFCANHLVGKAWRQRSIESVMAELLTITPPRRRSFKWVKFWDPCFLTDSDRIEELCDRILENGLERHFRFIAETRTEDVIRGREVLGKMRKAGFARIGCGIESPNRKTHVNLNKGINLKHVQQAADLLDEADIMFSKFLIIGHENEDEADILNYPDYALSQGVDRQNTTFFVMTPYPGTQLGARYREQDLITSFDWDLYTNFGSVIAPSGISSLRLQTLHCGVKAKYGLYRRFNQGAPLSKGLSKLFEALFIHTKMMVFSGQYSAAEVEESLWEALAAVGGSDEERPCRNRTKGRAARDLAIAFHARDRAPVIIRLSHCDGMERLTIDVSEAGNDGDGRKVKTYHISLGRIVRLTERTDYRKLAHDAMTFRTSPRGFKLRWLPSTVAGLARVFAGLAGMGIFHLGRRLRG